MPVVSAQDIDFIEQGIIELGFDVTKTKNN